MQDKKTFPDSASMDAPATMKYDGSHKLRLILIGADSTSRGRLGGGGQRAPGKSLRLGSRQKLILRWLEEGGRQILDLFACHAQTRWPSKVHRPES